MKCGICTEHFDATDRVPKVLVPCGHTVCLQCLGLLPDSRCPTCRRDFNGPPPELPTNFTVLQLLEGVRQERSPCAWCSDCRAAATPRCWEQHDVLSVRSALRRQLRDAQPQVDEQLQGLRDEQALAALTLLTGETWDVTLRGGGRELTGDPAKKILRLLLAAALTEDRAAAPDSPPAAGSPPTAVSPPPAAEALPQREMNVSAFSDSEPDAHQQEKAAALLDAPGVTRLVGVTCNKDPAWSLQLLQLAGPTVEQLSVSLVRKEHLLAVHAMPRLRRLEMLRGEFDPNVLPCNRTIPLLPALPPSHAGLTWLRVWSLPRATTHCLLKAHARSLQSLELEVQAHGITPWPGCLDLPSLLEQCGLRELVRLVLARNCSRNRDLCRAQRAEVRKALPGPQVLCTSCDFDEKELV